MTASGMPRVENTRALVARKVTAGMMREFLAGAADDAEMSFFTSHGDRPGEITYHTLRITETKMWEHDDD